MKSLIVFCIITVIIGCSNKNNSETNERFNIESQTIMDTVNEFDIDKYKSNISLEDDSYEFTKEKGELVQQFMSEGIYYVEYVRPQDSIFITYRKYYNNGMIKEEGSRYYQGGWKKGIWKYYDKAGRLTESINEDKPFSYTWEDILSFTKKNNINIHDYNTRIMRMNEDGKYWIIMWHNINDGIAKMAKTIYLDGDTGKIISKKEAGIEK